MNTCKCGCGEDAGVYAQTDCRRGDIKGMPRKFIRGHNVRGRDVSEHTRELLSRHHNPLSIRPSKSLEESFWEKVNKDGPVPTHCPELGSCYLWTAGKHPLGYGLLWDSEIAALRRATHVSFFLCTGEWPVLHMLHKCDNPKCVRFSHLEEGTRSKNMQDAVKRGLLVNPKGEDAPRAKLTWAQVSTIRTKYAQGNTTCRELAKKYGVNNSSISCIVRGVKWKI